MRVSKTHRITISSDAPFITTFTKTEEDPLEHTSQKFAFTSLGKSLIVLRATPVTVPTTAWRSFTTPISTRPNFVLPTLSPAAPPVSTKNFAHSLTTRTSSLLNWLRNTPSTWTFICSSSRQFGALTAKMTTTAKSAFMPITGKTLEGGPPAFLIKAKCVHIGK